MVQRDRNHPSVIAWSLGNESGLRRQPRGGRRLAPSRRPVRPLHYEGAIRFDWARGQTVTDLVCPMYPPIAAIVGHADVGRAAPPADHVRVRARDGQQQRHARPSTGTRSSRRPGSRAASSGSGATTASCRTCPTAPRARPTAATSATCPTTARSCIDGITFSGPLARSPRMWEHRHRRPGPRRPVRDAAGDGRSRSRTAASSATLGWLRATLELSGRRRRGRGAATCRCRRSRPGETRDVATPRAAAAPATPATASASLTIALPRAAEAAVGPGRATRSAGRRSPLVGAAVAPRRRPTGAGPATSRSMTRAYLVHPARSRRRRPWRSGAPRPTTTGSAAWPTAGRRWGSPALTRRRRRSSATADATSSARPGRRRPGIEIPHRAARPAPRRRRDPRRGDRRGSRPSSTTSPRVGTVLELAAGHEAFELVRARPARVVPGPASGRRCVGRWRSTVDRRSSSRTSGRRRTAATPTSAGSTLVDATAAAAPHRPRPAAPGLASPTHRAADLDAATHDVELRPAAGDDRPPRRRPPRAWARRAAGPTRSPRTSCGRRHLPLDLDPARPMPRGRRCRSTGDEAPASAHLHNGATSWVVRVLENGWLGHLHSGAPLRPGPLVRATSGPVPFDGFDQPRRRAGRPRATRRRASATSGSRRSSSSGADGSTVLDLRYATHRILPGKPALPEACRRPTPRPTTRRETLEVDARRRADRARRSTLRFTLFARPPGRRPQR